MSLAFKRIRQIEISLQELSDLSIASDITREQRNFIASQIRELMQERANLEDNHDHWLADTKPSMKAVSDLVSKDLHDSSARKEMRS